MELVVLSDSHLSAGFDAVGAQILHAVTEADVVLHAGDVTSRQALEELGALVETYAVLGNNDHDLVGILQESRMLELAGGRIALVHDSGATLTRAPTGRNEGEGQAFVPSIPECRPRRLRA
jgi:uncharacterized protein